MHPHVCRTAHWRDTRFTLQLHSQVSMAGGPGVSGAAASWLRKAVAQIPKPRDAINILISSSQTGNFPTCNAWRNGNFTNPAYLNYFREISETTSTRTLHLKFAVSRGGGRPIRMSPPRTVQQHPAAVGDIAASASRKCSPFFRAVGAVKPPN